MERIMFVFLNILLFQFHFTTSSVYYNQLEEGYELTSAPHGAVSMAFVFDTTGSMYDDLRQVTEGATKILATTLNRREKPLYNYIIVPFHDPGGWHLHYDDVGPVTVTTDPNKFQQTLRDLYVQGGGDCPEMCITAIKIALEKSLPNSFIYVFTDARAKDYSLTEEVLTLIQQKQSQVVFVLTGDCGDPTHIGFKSYQQIASTSSGQVFLLPKEQVNKVLDVVSEAVQSRKVNLVSVDRSTADELITIELNVDYRLKEFTISMSGDGPNITVLDPSGTPMSSETGLNTLLKLNNALIVNIKDPMPGVWILKIKAKGPHTIRINGLSSLDFIHGFSTQPTLQMSETSSRPIKDIPSNLLINATELVLPGKIEGVVLLDLHGNPLLELPVSHDPSRPHLYNVSSFSPPLEYFYLRVNGIDEHGYRFQRLTPTALSAVDADPPRVKMADVTKGFFGEEVVLTCHVTSVVPFTVQWSRDGFDVEDRLFFPYNANVTLSVPDARSTSEGIYRCNASNSAGWNVSETFLDIKDPPPLLAKPQDVFVAQGSNALLSCFVQSTVDFNVTWIRKDFKFVETKHIKLSNGSLLIRDVSNSDEGIYICKASNEGGSNEEKISLSVYKRPSVVAKTEKMSFVEGSRVSLHCSATSHSDITFAWKRFGKEVETSDRITISDDGHLVIERTQKSDSGLWECVSTNDYGSASASINLEYMEHPVIRDENTYVLVNSGDTAVLDCKATGIPSPEISWSKNGIELQEMPYIHLTKTGRLTIDGTQELDSGDYQCMASNAAGTAVKIFKLEIGSAPVIIRPPQNQEVEILKNSTLYCSATGKPTPEISWTKDYAPLSDKQNLQVMKSGALFIQNIQKEDEGMYTCTAKNGFGSAASSAYVDVTGIVRPLIAYTSPILEILEGRDATLSCVVLIGNPMPQVVWYKMGEAIEADGSRIFSNALGTLQIKKVTVADEGDYICVAHNVGGNATHATKIDVQVPPSIEETHSEFSVIEGSSIRLPCRASGDPKPSISWTKNGMKIFESDPYYFINENGDLDIFSAKLQDSATYSCSAINLAGVKEKRISLFVKTAPKIAEDMIEFNVIMNNPVQLTCDATGNPTPQITWTKGNEEINNYTSNVVFLPNGSLRISRVTVEDSGRYQCTASSEAGVAHKFVTLNVRVPPRLERVAPETIISITGEEVLLPCDVIGDPKPDIIWKKDLSKLSLNVPTQKFELKENGGLKIKQVEVVDTGRYLCIAENIAGVVTQEINFIVHEPPTIVEHSVNELTTIENNLVVLPCRAHGTPLPTIKWYKNGDELTPASDPNLLFLPDGTLQIENTRESHAGSYECVAENIAGSASHHIQLLVFLPPRFGDLEDSIDVDIDSDPDGVQNKNVVMNGTVILNCHVYATPPPTIAWYKNGEELTSSNEEESRVKIMDEGRELVIHLASSEDSARYTCVARNLAGEIEKNFDLDVFVRPYFEDEATVQVVSGVVNTPFVINCPASGVPHPDIEWYKDGELITPGWHNIQIFLNGRQLEIKSLDVGDEGIFSCVAKNPAGEVTRNFDLEVMVPAHIDQSSEVTESEAIAQNSVLFYCPAMGMPVPEIKWFKDGVVIHPGSANEEILDDGSLLRIHRVEVTHAGRFTCVATNRAGEDRKHFNLIVFEVPQITRDKTVLSPQVVLNRTIVINCPASGTPPPDIVWLKNGISIGNVPGSNVLSLSEGKQLRIANATMSDSGDYRCVASNKAGTDNLDFHLSVHIPASIDRQGLDHNPSAIVNQSKILDCPAIGIPAPKVVWHKNGFELHQDSSENVILHNGGRRLEMMVLQEYDSGMYECTAENEAGSDRIIYDFKVLVPPSINPATSSASNLEVFVDQTTMLFCDVYGIPFPNVSWFHSGELLSDVDYKYRILEEGRQLEIYKADTDGAGTYTCMAKNDAGVADREFHLMVLVPPVIDITNMDLYPKVVKGKAITLNCMVHGIPFPNITWFKNDLKVEESSKVRLLLSGRQLEVSMAEISDAAVYTCVAVNIAGQASQEFSLSVHVPPAIDEANLVDNPRIVVNRTVLLECPVAGVPLPTVKWLKNNQPIEMYMEGNPGSIQLLEEGRHLEIRHSQVSDSAKYTCIAKNDAGELARDFYLDVMVPPSITGEETVENINVIENQTAVFFCFAEGLPHPTIIWYKENVPLLDSPYTNLQELNGGRELKMRHVQLGDAGFYSCRASNDAGEKEKQFRLKVIVPPKIFEGNTESSVDVLIGNSAYLGCDASGVPDPTISWLKDGRPVDKIPNVRILRDGRVFEVLTISVEDSGIYTCEAKNDAGQTWKRIRLIVQVPPRIVDDHITMKQEVVNGNSVTMRCEVSGTPEPVIRWTRNNEPYSFTVHSNLRVLDNGKSLEVYNAQIVDSGFYRCHASNDAGNATKEFHLAVNVPPSIEGGPAEVAGVVGGRVILSCEVMGLPKPQVTWEKDGSLIDIVPGNGMMIQRSGSLQISAVKVSDTGSYRCSAKNSAGSTSRDVQLTVQVPPKIEHEGPSKLKAVVGETIYLPCLTSGIPKPKVSWQKGTRIMLDVPGFELLSDDSLKISQVDVKDTGIYICVAQNSAGTAMGQVRLEVQVSPKVEIPQTIYEVVQDREIILPCQAHGTPHPSISWKKDGRTLDENDLRYRTLKTGWLAIALSRHEDTGIYTCIAENEAGKASVDINVVVHVPPLIEESERILTANQGDAIKLPCKVTGYPAAQISWIHDGKIMISAEEAEEESNLIFEHVKVSDAGNYICTAKNIAGRDSKEVVMKVYAPPSVTMELQNTEVTLNGKIELDCVADGIPSPLIYWKINDTEFNTLKSLMKNNRVYKVTRSMNGKSKLIIDDAVKEDEGSYACVAENVAGTRQIVADIKIKVPPKVTVHSGAETISISGNVSLHCPVEGADPLPMIIWTKDSQPVAENGRIHLLENGTLVIYSVEENDHGEYKCSASNDAGSSEGVIFLTIRMPPHFRVEPSPHTAEQGSIVTLDCLAEGEPEPQILWLKNENVLRTEDRFTILPNNSLRIVAVQLSDSGVFQCIAKNMLGFKKAEAELTVKVHGHYSPWSTWTKCSVSCGEGVRLRTRSCNNPEPANGGRLCQGPSSETKVCATQSCPVDGNWGEWSTWNECSQTCGSGVKVRNRECNNPTPQFGGQPCQGSYSDQLECNSKPCPVNGGWSSWSAWDPCSETCGEGTQERHRSCDSPMPEHGGQSCSGPDVVTKACKVVDCEINGNWGSWTEWSICTLSCGGGMRNRKRKCDSPAPSRDGRFCPGTDVQIDYCNKEDCPVHGNWAEWSAWGDCTLTCGGGQRRRFRTCTNPMPRHSGRPCIGASQETEVCNSQRCAVDGSWSSWSQWSECSKSCDGGSHERQRTCRLPLFGGFSCPGDASQVKKCNIHPCKAIFPKKARAKITGKLNNDDLYGLLEVNISRSMFGTLNVGLISNVTRDVGNNLKPLVSILSPVYWTTATEAGKATNGLTLTQGHFLKKAQVEFATGEILKIVHTSHGIDSDGVLNYDVVLDGNVTKIFSDVEVVVIPFSENYLQDGPGSLYASSSRLIQIDNHSLPYAWNQSITYNVDYGKMPYLVEKLTVEDVKVDFGKDVLKYELVAYISKGDPSNQCPPGFLLDPEGPYCRDEDECSQVNPCSHSCLNKIGSFSCSCPSGYVLDLTGKICNDIDECDLNTYRCLTGQQCINSVGSYRCVQRCENGFRRSFLSQNCEDINECQEIPNVCDHTCNNMPGSYRCLCRKGFKLVSKSKCKDINECESEHMCSHECHNTVGSYRCSCPGGFRKASETNCSDIDECEEGKHNCLYGQKCQNKPGGFTCVNTCPVGFRHFLNGSCVDMDECSMGLHECKHNQVCVNTPGSYICSCARGFKKSSNNQTCTDINECTGNKNPCQYKCENTDGGFKCSCPPGQRLLPDRKSCQDVNSMEHQKVLSTSPFKCHAKPNGRPCVSDNQHEICPRGYMPSNGKCIDIDECQKKARCQHGCQNVQGSYYCTCPAGYRLSPNKRTCLDVDECVENSVICGPNQKCFNKKGDYECVDITCPPKYDRDLISGNCALNCSTPGVTCPPGRLYKDVLEYHLIALPNGIPAHKDLIRLVAYDQEDVHLPHTTFKILETDKITPFAIRLEEGKGVVYTLRPLREKKLYKMKVESRSTDHRRKGVVYNTTFMLYISVAKYPY